MVQRANPMPVPVPVPDKPPAGAKSAQREGKPVGQCSNPKARREGKPARQCSNPKAPRNGPAQQIGHGHGHGHGHGLFKHGRGWFGQGFLTACGMARYPQPLTLTNETES